ncbi:PREDICTED: PHD finger protein 12 [Nicrophorus vespilloides]|uniref:PHD finger protein 12 n=1 Tax=Nicrophorus vespilloides TaxID=110193 RepID=A0ABM1N595_NICVS|nr:PREDICTED: PHD finger protein 12 [Nicrophorus vespilloides]
MANVDYELDGSGGLMAQVQALIAPPVSEDKASTSAAAKAAQKNHPYYKRPGRGHNHDLCDSCGEGGDLICCDKCPFSFHLQCHNPPLEEHDIPEGEWLCHSCRNKSLKSMQSKTTNSMALLIRAASLENPKQFELPRHMMEPCYFPGTDKVEKFRAGKRPPTTASTSTANRKDTALPSSKCYVCSKTCRSGTLISCDFCPLFFHLDCLDPPLATPPSDRWMCPNHVQHILDSKLLTSSSATERNRLWAQYAHQPVDQDAIKLEFFRRVHRSNPPFRFKVKMSTRRRVSVPMMVKMHYRKPIALLPSLRDVLRLNTVVNREIFEIIKQEVDQMKEDEIKSVSDDVEIVSEERCDDVMETVDMTEDDVEMVTEMEVDKEDVQENVFELTNEAGEFLEQVLKEEKFKRSVEKTTKEEVVEIKEEVKREHHEEKCLPYNGCDYISDNSFELMEAERELRQIDDRVLKLLALQRIQQILYTQQHTEESYQLSAYLSQAHSSSLQSVLRNCNMPLPSQLLTAADIERIARVFSSPKKQRNSGNGSRIIASGVSSLRARAMLCPVVSKYFYNVRSSDGTEIRHDASFMGYRPTVSARFPEALSMRYRSLSIGRGAANHLQLDRYGHCNNVSPKHAVIFFDEFTKQYELLNYSQHGSYVNNVLYSNHVIERPHKVNHHRSAELDKQVRDIVDKRRKVMRRCKSMNSDAKMISMDSNLGKECSCVTGTSGNRHLPPEEQNNSAGWEGSALLHHGSLLRFGCVSFVFSIVDCATL